MFFWWCGAIHHTYTLAHPGGATSGSRVTTPTFVARLYIIYTLCFFLLYIFSCLQCDATKIHPPEAGERRYRLSQCTLGALITPIGTKMRVFPRFPQPPGNTTLRRGFTIHLFIIISRYYIEFFFILFFSCKKSNFFFAIFKNDKLYYRGNVKKREIPHVVVSLTRERVVARKLVIWPKWASSSSTSETRGE